MRKKKKNHYKIVSIVRSKLRSIENIISKTLVNNEIIHKDFATVRNEERNVKVLECLRIKKVI